MFSFDSLALLAFLLHSLLLCLPVHSIPLGARQATQVSSVTTAVFPTATCVISFSPEKDAQGTDIIVEVRVCVAEKDPLSSEGSTTSTSPSLTTPSSASTTTITVTLPPTSSPSINAIPPSINAIPSISTSPSTTSTSSSPSSTSPPTISTDLAPSPSSTTSSVPLQSGAVGGVPLPSDTNSPTTSTIPPPETSSSVQPSAAGVSVVAAAESSMPGKKLSVLPIGLGVFAGISVIALIVVGLVTYERTKYRKAFRQRKLAEAGAPMGYGGTEY